MISRTTRPRYDPNLGYDVQLIANKQGFDETVLECASCAERVHGVLALPAYGDLSVSEMGRIMALHDKWRKIDADAERADGGAAGEHRSRGQLAGLVARARSSAPAAPPHPHEHRSYGAAVRVTSESGT